jgi:hypothetical protein
MSAKQIQAEFYNLENATSYYEQYFTIQTRKKITIEDWQQINYFLDTIVVLMSQGEKVSLQYFPIKKQEQ